MAGVKQQDLKAFHELATSAAQEGKTIKQFAREQSSLTNNIKARLYEAFVKHNLKPVEFPKPKRKSRGRKSKPTNRSSAYLYTGRAKVPYLTLKVPKTVVSECGAQASDIFEWRINRRGDIVARNMSQGERETETES